ncbi:MAG TPA: VWA domain-containing protein [Thermoanaerobaculia bacterium]|nr:VWA domain-containing protein [Thermoanaerobaculia bacterium]
MSSDARRFVAAFSLFLLLLPSSLSAQQIPSLGETIEVSIVNVEVFVTDKQGNRVRGLTRGDFEIRENGKTQPITNFAEYAPEGGEGRGTVTVDAPSAPGEPAAVPASAAPVKRTIVVFVDAFTMPDFHARDFFGGIRDLMRRTVRPGDAVAVVTWSGLSLIRQEFTDDLDAIEAALAKVEEESTGPFNDPTAYARRQEAFELALQSDLMAAGYAVDAGASASFAALSEATFERYRIKQKTAAIQSFIQSMSGVEGKKLMILAMNRYGAYAGTEYFGGQIPFRNIGELDTRQYRDELARTANANGITLYPLYPPGLLWTPRATAMESRADIYTIDSDQDIARSAVDHNVLMNETASLTELADRTGGLSHYGSKNIVELLPRIADDIESYYSLGYRATTHGRDDARKVVVVPKNRNYVVRSRDQFVEKSDQTKMNDRVVANLFQPLDTAAIPIEAEIGAWKRTAKNRWTAPLKVRVPVSALTTIAGTDGASGGFSVYVASGGILGVMGDVERRTQPFTIPQGELARTKDTHFTYELTLEVDQVTRRISIGVLDEVSREYGLMRIEVAPQPRKNAVDGGTLPAS